MRQKREAARRGRKRDGRRPRRARRMRRGAKAAEARARAAAEEVIAPLRVLGFRADEAHRAAALCEAIPDAPLRAACAPGACLLPAAGRVRTHAPSAKSSGPP